MDTTDTLQEAAQSLLMKAAPDAEAGEAVEEQSGNTEEVAQTEPEEQVDATEMDDAEEQSAASEEPELYVVKVRGVERKVTLAELKQDYSGQQAVHEGLREAAAARKEAEALMQTAREQQEQVIQLVQMIQSEGVKPPPKPLDHSMAAKDLVGYTKELARYNAEMEAYAAQQQKLTAAQRQIQEQQAAQLAQYTEAQRAEMYRRIPDIADPEKGKAVMQELFAAGERYGFSQQELGEVRDARAVEVLWKAAQYDKLNAMKADPVKVPPKVVKPVARSPRPEQSRQDELRRKAMKSGDLADWSQLLLVRKS